MGKKKKKTKNKTGNTNNMPLFEVSDGLTPEQKKRYVESELKRAQYAVRKINRNVKTFLEGVYGKRRAKAILSYLDQAEEEYKSFGVPCIMESFTIRELTPISHYNIIDSNCDIRIAAALWILEKLRKNGTLIKAYDILPDMSGEINYYLPWDFVHPCYSNDLIESVIDVISGRYPVSDDPGIILTEFNASGTKPSKAYMDLMELLPKEDVDLACAAFKEKIWEVSTRHMKGRGYYDREISRIDQEIEAWENAMKPPLPGMMPGPFSQPQRSPGMPAASGAPDLSFGTFHGSSDGLRALGTMDGSRNALRLAFRGQYLEQKSQEYKLDFDRYLLMDQKEIRQESGSKEIADALGGFSVSNPYELCFALFYLIDHGDYAPWLMYSGSALMMFCLNMLPWFVDPKDWSEEQFEAWYDGPQYNREGWLEQGEVEEPIDFYHEKHGDRNLAQVIYDLCRTVVPTGLHPFEKDRKKLIEEGMDEDLARKITDTAEILFLYEFQAKPDVLYEYDDLLEEQESEEDERTMSLPAEDVKITQEADAVRDHSISLDITIPKNSELWEKIMGQHLQEKQLEQNQDTESDIDVEKLLKDMSEANKLIKSLRKALALTKQEASSERSKYEHELKSLRMEHRELSDLRELVFNANQPDDVQKKREKPQKNYSYPYETRKRTVVFGGHDSFLRAIRPMLPDVKFVDAQNLTYSPEIIRNADVVWIQNNCISHSQYWSIVRNCKTAGVQMRYFSFASAEKCAEQLVSEDMK